MLKKLHTPIRETIVRGVSRGGEFVIANGLILANGETWFLYATTAGITWSVSTDYIGQRFWTYPARVTCKKKLLRNTVPYVILRIAVGAGGLGTLTFLFFILSVPYFFASCITIAIFWRVSYQVTKVFFTGSSHGQPRWFRHLWIALRLRHRKRLRIS